MSSPLRSSSVKKTYLDRPKPSRAGNEKLGDTDTESNNEEEILNKKPLSKAKSMNSIRPPDSTASKASFKRPKTPPKREPSEVISKKGAHVRGSSSISNLSQLARQQQSSPSTSSKKPVSRKGSMAAPPSPSRQGAPTESEVDDATSIAESFMSGKVRRTEKERIEYFKNQPECDMEGIEPHRVKCLRCRKYVSLGKRTKYAVRPWELHRATCDLKVPHSMMTDGSASLREDDNASTITGRRPKTTEAERRKMLEDDPQVDTVKPDEALCKRCKKWIHLSKRTMYHLPNWRAHRKVCFDPVPSDRVAAAERKLRIVNDSLAKSHGPEYVECGICGNTVKLDGPGEYNLTNWDQHKLSCPGHPPNMQADTFALSVTSEQTLLNDVQPSSGSPGRGTKRAREEEDEALPVDDEDFRPAVRPRSEKEKPVEKDAPNPFGWILMPVKAFVTGFKGSISSPST